MRMDVKLGVAISLFVVLLAGGYYVYRDKQEKPIPVGRSAPALAMQQTPSGQVTRASTAKNPAKRKQLAQSGSAGKSVKTTSSGGNAARGQTSASPKSAVANPRVSKSGRPTATSSQRNSVTGQRGSTNPQPQRHAARTGGAADPVTTNAEQATKMASRKTSNKTNKNKSSAEKASRRQVSRSGSGDTKTGGTAPRASSATNRTVLASTSTPNQTDGSVRPPSVTDARKSRPVPTKSATARSGGGGKASKVDTLTSRQTGVAKPSSIVAIDTHKVQQGDTLASLATMYYGHEKHTAFLIASNPQIEDARRLRVGMSIKLPSLDGAETGSAGSDARRPSASNTYTVQPGDTFYGIARDKLGNSSRWQELFDLNKSLVDNDPTRLRPGQVISLPKT